MGSPISSTIAEIFLQHMESTLIKQLFDTKNIAFYTRYVDDILLIYRVILSLEAPNKFGKSNPEFGETHSSVLGCERRTVSASIMSRPCFASFLVCVYKFSSHYLNNIIFYRQ